jgi:hypothetical protein
MTSKAVERDSTFPLSSRFDDRVHLINELPAGHRKPVARIAAVLCAKAKINAKPVIEKPSSSPQPSASAATVVCGGLLALSVPAESHRAG